ncbi:MAG TPA: GGDEF domain-containing protein [Candidatus Binatia bacterium]|nr:GGDEF domain-containing protein [Candidatus Binatia bacterium]
MSFPKPTPERFVPRMAECIAASLAILALAGWILRLPALTSIMPGLVSMKPNTAIGFLLLAGALYSSEQKRWPRCQRWLALAAAAIGSLTLFEYMAGRNLGLDEALFRDPGGSLYPGRMAPITAFNFILLASAFLVPPFKRSDYVRELLVLLLALSSTFAIVGYIYGVPALYGAITTSSTAMALHTGVSFLVMAIGFLFIEREEGFVRLFRGPSIASMAARYLVPPAVLVPVVLGGLFIRSRWNLGHPHLVMALSVVSDIVLLVVLIWLFAAMIHRVETERALIQQQAETDKLTGIYNRRHFETSLELEIQRARRYGAPLALLMIDVDNFKQLNDSYGHLVGDRMLCRLARECESCLRTSDVFCRYGGDEFVIIAPETSGQAAVRMARRMRQNIDALGMDQSFGTLGISIGIAVWEDKFETTDDFIAAADSALYQAKSAGRNRECLYPPKSLLTG